MPASRHSTFSLASLYIFRNWGICKLNISVGLTPFSLATSWTWSINGQGWVKYAFATPAVARYISVTALGQTGGNLLEMAVYGNLTSPTNPNPPAGTAPTAPPLGLLLGLNAVTGTDVSLMAGVTGAIRENQVCCSREMTTVVFLRCYAGLAHPPPPRRRTGSGPSLRLPRTRFNPRQLASASIPGMPICRAPASPCTSPSG